MAKLRIRKDRDGVPRWHVLDWTDAAGRRHQVTLGPVGVLRQRELDDILRAKQLELSTGARILDLPAARGVVPTFGEWADDTYLPWHALEYPHSHARIAQIVEQHLLPRFPVEHSERMLAVLQRRHEEAMPINTQRLQEDPVPLAFYEWRFDNGVTLATAINMKTHEVFVSPLVYPGGATMALKDSQWDGEPAIQLKKGFLFRAGWVRRKTRSPKCLRALDTLERITLERFAADDHDAEAKVRAQAEAVAVDAALGVLVEESLRKQSADVALAPPRTVH